MDKQQKKVLDNMNRAKQESIFCLLVLLPFVIQWLVFWVYGNINSIRLAFTFYNTSSLQHDLLPFSMLLKNFIDFIKDVFSQSGGILLFNGMYMHLLSTLVCLPFSYFISYIIYKKLPLSGFFKIILYLPSILSSMVIIILFKHFIEWGFDGMVFELFNTKLPMLFSDRRYNRLIITIYILFFGLPGNLLINLGSMSRIPSDLIEYGELEGISLFKEFCMIIIPMVFPVLQVQCLGLFTGFFTTQGPLYIFYEGNAPDNLQSFGYFMFTSIYGGREGVKVEMMYGYTSAANLLIGLISVPIVQGTKKLLDKLDPGAEF